MTNDQKTVGNLQAIITRQNIQMSKLKVEHEQELVKLHKSYGNDVYIGNMLTLAVALVAFVLGTML